MIKLIKIIHTFIWLVMATATSYILYAGITNRQDGLLVISLLLMTLESVVLVLNRWTCPLTPWAQKYTANRNSNFDIYLPNWLAKYNKIIFGTMFGVGIILLIINWLRGL